MKYCVIKGTFTPINSCPEGFESALILSAKSAGFDISEVEIINAETYEERKALEPEKIEKPSLEERLLIAEETINVILGL